MIKIIEKQCDDLIPYENNARINDKAVEYVANSKYTKERICVDCGKIDVIRKDSHATRCVSCSAKIANKASQKTRRKNEKKCKECGSTFCSPKSNNKRFCSKECLQKYKDSLLASRKCVQCGVEFKVLKSSLRSNATGRFCCRECYNLFQKTLTKEKNNHCTGKIIKCANCGKDVWAIPSDFLLYKNKFCSIKCRGEYMVNYVGGEKNANWKGGFSLYRGDDFEKIKKKEFKDCRCVLCGTKKDIHIHHIVPYRLTTDNSVENLVPLCRKHHKQIENIWVKILEPLGIHTTAGIVMRNILDEQKMVLGGLIINGQIEN